MSRFLHDLNSDLANLAVRFSADAGRARAEAARLTDELDRVVTGLEARRAGELVAFAPPGDDRFLAVRRDAINTKYDQVIAGERVRYNTKIAQARETAARESWRAEQARQGLLGVDPTNVLDLLDVRRDAPEVVAEAFRQERAVYYTPDVAIDTYTASVA